jgi:hypothetical protein
VRDDSDRGQGAWLLYLLVGILATVGYFLLPSATVQNIFNVLIDLCVVAAIVAGIFMHRPGHALAWYLFAIGMVVMSAGDVLWAIAFLGIGRYKSADNPFAPLRWGRGGGLLLAFNLTWIPPDPVIGPT